MRAWLGVASAEHVRSGVEQGIAQIGHGKRGGLARMNGGDTIVYYSPVEVLGDKAPLQQFTAIGEIADDEIFQEHESEIHMFRRRVTYEHLTPVPLSRVRDQLRLTSTPNWGYQLRLGLVPLDERDVEVLRAAMS